jgi:ABC-type multidrug transport system permease subunit
MIAMFLPTMLFMALCFVAQGLSDDVWRERSLGTLRRALTTPARVPALFLGKLLAGAAVAAVVAAAGLVAASALLDVGPLAALVALVWATLTAVVLTLLMTALQLFASSQRAGNTLTNVVLFPLLMLGGCFFPFEAMPGWMERVGRLTPNGFALTEFQWLLGGGLEPLRLARDLALAALVGGALFALCVRRVSGSFARA